MTLQFANHTDRIVNVYWINYDCTEELYMTLGPGKSYSQDSFVTHPWVVRDALSGTPLAATIAEGNATVDIGG